MKVKRVVALAIKKPIVKAVYEHLVFDPGW
jgi:hypothetical protein